MLSIISILSLLAVGSVAVDECMQSQYRILNNRECREVCRIDRPGGDYAQLQIKTWSGCMQACAADLKCVTAQYRPDNGFCYLKNVRNGARDDPTGYTVDCDPPAASSSTTAASPQCSAGTRYLQGRACTTLCNTDRPGGDYSSMRTNTHEACIQACAGDIKCVTAQYHESSGYCYLKSTRNAAKSVSGETTFDCDANIYGCGPSTSDCSGYAINCANQVDYNSDCLCFRTLDGPTCASASLPQKRYCKFSSDCPPNNICALFSQSCEQSGVCFAVVSQCTNKQTPKFIFARSPRPSAQKFDILG